LLPPLPPQSNQECSFFAHFYPCISQPHLDSIILPNNTLHESQHTRQRKLSHAWQPSVTSCFHDWHMFVRYRFDISSDDAMAFEESKRSNMNHDSTSSSVRCILLMQGAIVCHTSVFMTLWHTHTSIHDITTKYLKPAELTIWLLIQKV
jgi:hypothetical protein